MMNMSMVILAALSLWIQTPILIAQTTIYGTVKDRDTGRALSCTNIQIEGTYRGTITNDEGAFSLRVDDGQTTLVFTFIGYEPQKIFVSEETPQPLDVRLRPVVIQLPPIVVDGEDPAVKIMRKVLRKKEEWWDTFQTCRADAYCRATFYSDTGIFLIREVILEAYWDKVRGSRDVIKTIRQTADPGLDFIPNVGHLPNFYNDNVEIANFNMISVVHPKALKYYRFKLIGERAMGSKTVFDISVEPKTRLQPVFRGKIMVLHEDYALIGVELETADHIIFPMPIREAHYSFKQQFSNFGETFWLPVSMVREGEAKIGFPGFELDPLRFRDIYEIRDYRVNIPLPDTLFRGDEVVRIDTAVTQNDTMPAQENAVVVPLTGEEKAAYENADSTFSFIKALNPRGMLGKLFIKAEEEEKEKAKTRESGERRFSFTPQAWYNRTDGLYAAVKSTVRLKKQMDVDLLLGYTFALNRWTSGAAFRTGFVTLEYFRETDLRYRSGLYPRQLTGLFTLFGHVDYFDYCWNEWAEIDFTRRFDKIQTEVEFGFRSDKYTSLAKTTDYVLLGKHSARRENPGVDEGTLRSVHLRIQYGSKFIPFGVAGQRRIDFTVEHSPKKSFSSDFSYSRFDCDVYWRVNTFLARRILPCCFDLRITAGIHMGDLPLQRYGIVDASLGMLNSFGAFKSLRRLPYEGEDYLGVFWEHNFRTVPWELLGLRGISQRGIEFILHGASGRTWTGKERLDTLEFQPNDIDHFHHEIGFSINKLFNFFRFDFTQRLDEAAFYFSISAPRFF